MAIYSCGWTSAVSTINLPMADMKAGAIANARLYELVINNGANTAGSWGLGRPGNDGSVVQTGTTLTQAENAGDAVGLTKVAATWSTAPTIPAVFNRRAAMNGNIGNGVIWSFPRGMLMLVNKGLVVWNITANPATQCLYGTFDE